MPKKNAHLVGEDEFTLTKSLLGGITGFGISHITGAAISSVVDKSALGLPMKVCVMVAQIGISGAIGEVVNNHNERFINELIGSVRQAKIDMALDEDDD